MSGGRRAGNVVWDAASSSGSHNGAAKLDELLVHPEHSYSARGSSHRQVARVVRISRSQVGRIARGEAWRDV
jgi:hypothetical protein